MQQEFIPILDDDTVLNTAYYELWYQIDGNANWAQQTYLSPLPFYTIGSPAVSVPCIVISPLPDTTLYHYKVRRFNTDGLFSTWVTGNFTTGS